MNKFENQANTDVCIRDLKQLGREGGAQAYIDTGEILKLKPKYGTVSRRAYVAGKAMMVELKIAYKDVYPAIHTIDRNGIVIAKRCRYGMINRLKLTGTGYHRTWKRKLGGNT